MKAIRKLAIALLAGLSALIIALSTRAEGPPAKTPRIGHVSGLADPVDRMTTRCRNGTPPFDHHAVAPNGAAIPAARAPPIQEISR